MGTCLSCPPCRDKVAYLSGPPAGKRSVATPVTAHNALSDSTNAPKSDARAAFAFLFLVFVAVTKTLLTKTVFVHGTPPVAFSALSCIITAMCFVPIFIAQPSYYANLNSGMMVGFFWVCVAIALDLAFTNMAISLLSVALQQCIKASSPAATVILESLWNRTCHHPAKYAVITLLCLGPVLTNLGSSSFDSTPLGVAAMSMAVVAGAFKYVLAHAMIAKYKATLGTLAFTFWVEVFVAVMLAPWAILNGEMTQLVVGPDGKGVSASDWVLLCFTAGYGGVRIYSQVIATAPSSCTHTNVGREAPTHHVLG